MQKAIRAILAIFSRVLLIGMTIQIVFGTCWMVANLGSLQQFAKTSFCALIDDSIFLGIWQMIQVLIAFFAVFRMLSIFFHKHTAGLIWGSLVVITIPMVMQCHLAILPYSLTSSMLLLEIGSIIKYIYAKEKLTARVLLTILPYGIVASLLMPEYTLFCLLPVVLLLGQSIGRLWRENRKQIVANMWVFFAMAGICFAIQSFGQQDTKMDEDNLWDKVVSRIAWSTLQEDYFTLWTEEMRTQIDYNILLEGALYADGVEKILIPAIREKTGMDADAFLEEMVTMAWDAHSREILQQMAWDYTGYVFSPKIHHMLLQRRGYDSFSGRNYDIMLQHTPILTKYYVNYSCWWFGVAMVIALVMQILVAFQEKLMKWLRENGWILLVNGLIVVVMALWYTLQGAGMFDYKNTIAITCLWYVWMVILTISNIEEKDYGTTSKRKTA